MKTYEVMHTAGAPDWSKIPAISIDQHLWSDVRSIIPQAQAAWDENALYIRLSVKEKDILRRFTGPLDPVYTDSCLEFFFCPYPEGDHYFNFEINPNGAFYVGYGRPGIDRYRLYRDKPANHLQITPFEIPGGWGVELRIPVEFVQIFVPGFTLSSGKILRANFYKCGDETVQPHFIAWNPIDLPSPCFHCPNFFGQLRLV